MKEKPTIFKEIVVMLPKPDYNKITAQSRLMNISAGDLILHLAMVGAQTLNEAIERRNKEAEHEKDHKAEERQKESQEHHKD